MRVGVHPKKAYMVGVVQPGYKAPRNLLSARHTIYMVGIVQWLERQIVALEVVGSNPTTHPIY